MDVHDRPLLIEETCAEDGHHVVTALVLEWRGKVALLRRSRSSGYDQGKWQCITGVVEIGSDPRERVMELFEVTGLQAKDIRSLKDGPVLVKNGRQGKQCQVHTFTALTFQRRLELSWEHDKMRWVDPNRIKRFVNRVPWLDEVLRSSGHLH